MPSLNFEYWAFVRKRGRLQNAQTNLTLQAQCAAPGQAGGTRRFSQKALITKLVESAVSRQDGYKHPSNTTFLQALAAKHKKEATFVPNHNVL